MYFGANNVFKTLEKLIACRHFAYSAWWQNDLAELQIPIGP